MLEEEEAEMFPEGVIFMQEIDEVIKMFPEEKGGEDLSSAEIRPKRENAGAGIDRLLMYFYGKT